MSMVYRLPQGARYIPTNNTFSAAFGSPTYGLYDFNVASNKNQSVVELQQNTVYYVDYFQIAGNIPSETFLSVISTQPTLIFHRLLDSSVMFTKEIPISVFSAQVYLGTFIKSAKKGDALTASFNGVLSQNADLIGITPISINLKCSIFAIDEILFNKQFAGREFTKR
jgi:hypothetical protein